MKKKKKKERRLEKIRAFRNRSFIISEILFRNEQKEFG